MEVDKSGEDNKVEGALLAGKLLSMLELDTLVYTQVMACKLGAGMLAYKAKEEVVYKPEVDTLLAAIFASEDDLLEKLELESALVALPAKEPLGLLGLLLVKLPRQEAVTWLPVVADSREPSSLEESH